MADFIHKALEKRRSYVLDVSGKWMSENVCAIAHYTTFHA